MSTASWLRWGIVMAGLLAPLSVWGAEDPGDCPKNGGICGCSYGRVLCCDGSYAPRHYKDREGRIVLNSCAIPAHAMGIGTQLGTSYTSGRPNAARPQPLAPSQEIYWRGSIFDR